MYRSYTAQDYRQYLGLDSTHQVDACLIYGTYRQSPYLEFEQALARLGIDWVGLDLGDHDFLKSIRAIRAMGRTLWFSTAYGGAMLSEMLHLACLFGSQRNILIGSCGGLKAGASKVDVVMPDSVYATESSARGYEEPPDNRYRPDKALHDKLCAALSSRHTVHVGATVTHQSMMAESWEMIDNWSRQGFVGVEMEAATLFAVSRHFNVPAAAALRISDNLIEQETVLNATAETAVVRQRVIDDIWDQALRQLLYPYAQILSDCRS